MILKCLVIFYDSSLIVFVFYLQTPPLIRGQNTGYGGTLPKDARLLSDKHTTAGSHIDSNRCPGSSQPGQHEPIRTNSQRIQHRPRASTLPKGKPPVGPSGTPTGPGSQTPGALTPQGSVRRRGDSPARRGKISRQGSNCSTPSRAKCGFMSFGKGFFKKPGKWSSSAPNLGDTASNIGMLLIYLAWLFLLPPSPHLSLTHFILHNKNTVSSLLFRYALELTLGLSFIGVHLMTAAFSLSEMRNTRICYLFIYMSVCYCVNY